MKLSKHNMIVITYSWLKQIVTDVACVCANEHVSIRYGNICRLKSIMKYEDGMLVGIYYVFFILILIMPATSYDVWPAVYSENYQLQYVSNGVSNFLCEFSPLFQCLHYLLQKSFSVNACWRSKYWYDYVLIFSI